MNDKQQLQAMGEHQSEQHMCMAKQIEDLQARLQECANGAAKVQEQRDAAYVMAGKSRLERDKFAQQLKAANQQIAAMADLLIDLREGAELHLHNCTVLKNVLGISNWMNKLARIDAMLAAAPKPEPTK
ncbi:MAG: hypothetical protein ACRCXB_28565 [Aeromonadaceae bacterium]